MQIENICRKLSELYILYENFIWKNPKAKLEIIYENNGISLMLFEEDYVTEGFMIGFKPEERELYEYIAVRLFLSVLGNVMIHNTDNIFSNEKHKSYVKFVVNDEALFNILKVIQTAGNKVIITKDYHLIKTMYKMIPPRQRSKNDDLEMTVNNYYAFTKRRLREIEKETK